MKPDQHKIKKNARYKKKHSIEPSADNTTSTRPTRKNQTSARSSGSTSRTTQFSSNSNSPKQECQDRNVIISSSTSLGVDKNKLRASEKKSLPNTYSHHKGKSKNNSDYFTTPFETSKIESTWNSYQFSDDDSDQNESRQNKLSFLNENSSQTFSQFRFKDEILLQEDVEKNPDDLVSFNLDLPLLADSLSKLLLHERLGIKADLFHPDHIKAFEKRVINKKNSDFNKSFNLKSNSTADKLFSKQNTERETNNTSSVICDYEVDSLLNSITISSSGTPSERNKKLNNDSIQSPNVEELNSDIDRLLGFSNSCDLSDRSPLQSLRNDTPINDNLKRPTLQTDLCNSSHFNDNTCLLNDNQNSGKFSKLDDIDSFIDSL